MNLQSFFVKCKGYFFSGLLIVAPLGLTLWMLWVLISGIDHIFESLLPASPLFSIPGLGIIMGIVVLIAIGALAKGVFGAFLLRKGDSIVRTLPIVRSIYGGIKQVCEAFFGGKSVSFQEVGLLEYPRPGSWTMCFITGSAPLEMRQKTQQDLVNVFVPTTPNPTSGFLLMVPRHEIKILAMKVDEGLKMVLSVGIVSPADPPL